MQNFSQVTRPNLTIILVGSLLFPVLTWAQSEFEIAGKVPASEFLGTARMNGPNHSVSEFANNDGMLNHYEISSIYGNLIAGSSEDAIERIHELNVVAVLDEMSKTKEFATSVKESTKQVFVGARDLVTHPVDTIGSAASGVSKMFQRAGNTLFSDVPADSEDGRVKSIIGFTAAKRAYAEALNVDPYSDNAILQEKLDRVAWSAYAGGVSTAVGLGSISGPAGTMVDISNRTRQGVTADLTRAPLDLEKENRLALKEMGVDASIAELFLKNDVYPPSLETYITQSLRMLDGVINRQAALEVALRTDQRDVASYRQRQIAMYAAYHNRIAPLLVLQAARGGSVLAARTKDETLIVTAPIDYLAWTKDVGRAFIGEQLARDLGNTRKELWITGRASERCRLELKKLGWLLIEQANNKLGGAG